VSKRRGRGGEGIKGEGTGGGYEVRGEGKEESRWGDGWQGTGWDVNGMDREGSREGVLVARGKRGGGRRC